MTKRILTLTFIALGLWANAQTINESEAKKQAGQLTKSKDIKEGWTAGGSLNLNFTQTGVNGAWEKVSGGETQMIGIKAIVDYDIDMKKGKGKWLNNIRARYGMAKLSSSGDGFRKTDDYLNITSVYNRELKPKWGFAGLLNLDTRFDRYFLSPGTLKFGPGITYTPNKHFSALFSPAMGALFFKMAEEHKGIDLNNVVAGKSTNFGLGAFIQFKADVDIAKGINYKGFATMYSNYLNKPGSVILDWTNLFTLTVNKYIGATVSINIRNNDFEIGQMQSQYGLGVGFSYKL